MFPCRDAPPGMLQPDGIRMMVMSRNIVGHPSDDIGSYLDARASLMTDVSMSLSNSARPRGVRPLALAIHSSSTSSTSSWEVRLRPAPADLLGGEADHA